MPVEHRDAKKRARQSQRKALKNQATKTRLKTEGKKFQTAIAAGDKELAETLYKSTTKLFDRAAAKGVIHKNAASRKKSRLKLQLNKGAPSATKAKSPSAK